MFSSLTERRITTLSCYTADKYIIRMKIQVMFILQHYTASQTRRSQHKCTYCC